MTVPGWSFVAMGVPVPQGSMRGFVNPRTGRVIVAPDNRQTKPWREMIAWQSPRGPKSSARWPSTACSPCRRSSIPRRGRPVLQAGPTSTSSCELRSNAVTQNKRLMADDGQVAEIVRSAKVWPGLDPAALEAPGLLLAAVEMQWEWRQGPARRVKSALSRHRANRAGACRLKGESMAMQAEQQAFPLFEETEVHEYRVRVRNTGDGLSPSMAANEEIRLFQRVYVLMECDATFVGFAGDAESLTAARIADLRAGVACIVPASFAKAKIEAQRKRDEAHAEDVKRTKQEARERRAAARKEERRRFKIVQAGGDPDAPDEEPEDEPDDEPFVTGDQREAVTGEIRAGIPDNEGIIETLEELAGIGAE